MTKIICNVNLFDEKQTIHEYSFETNTKKMFEKILKKDEKVKSKTIYKEKHG